MPNSTIRDLWERLLSLELIRYGFVGAANTLGNYLLFVVLQVLVGDIIGYHAVLIVAFGVAALIAHRGHSVFTFRTEPNGTLARFMTVSFGLLILNEVLLTIAVEHYEFGVLLAQAALTILVAVSGFLLHQRYTFAQAGSVRGRRQTHGDRS